MIISLREIVVWCKQSGFIMKGTFECVKIKVGLMPKRVEPRNLISSLYGKVFFLYTKIIGGRFYGCGKNYG